mmetsp:Transcript_70035/g.152821  ORF Transcript_70035/g.152821 Transcript_70035/m.152821 type:complete len:88 (-) Transcript_70035:137-400(-)
MPGPATAFDGVNGRTEPDDTEEVEFDGVIVETEAVLELEPEAALVATVVAVAVGRMPDPAVCIFVTSSQRLGAGDAEETLTLCWVWN